jgi:hypothetical protein
VVTGDFNVDGYQTASPATGTKPTSIAVGDFKEDGIPDLAVVNAGDNTVSILIGKGDGTFTDGGTLSSGNTPVAVAAGNFMGTGFNGLAVANSDPADTNSSTLTVLNSVLTQTATATVTGISPSGAGAHLVEASYGGDNNYGSSVSSTTSLTGTAPAAPTATLSASSLTFSAQLVGSTSAAQTITLTSSGEAALAITSITASAEFQETNTCGSSVASGASCTISVTFAPTAAGSASGTLTITDNAAGSTQIVALSGTGESVSISLSSLR